VLREGDDDPSLGRERARAVSELPADLQRIVERLTKRQASIRRERTTRADLISYRFMYSNMYTFLA
jgi:hypothetical protein